MQPTIFIGYDSREPVAYDVCEHSIKRRASKPVTIKPLKIDSLKSRGLYKRENDPLASTEFTYSRFLVPYLCNYSGSAMFVDCDFLFLADIWELLDQLNPSYAVQCVKHNYKPTEKTKMDGVVQTTYPRKNWSSMVLWNCGHPSNKPLSLKTVNTQTGSYLHRFQWLKDDEIGNISHLWNFLEGWYRPVDNVKAVHFTMGGPWFKECQDVDFANLWTAEYKSMTGQDFKL